MGFLQLNLLGGFDLRHNDREVALPTRKTEGLLAYLALANGRLSSRDQVAGLLWSDRADEQARSSLRQSLAALRKSLNGGGERVIIARGDSVGLDPSLLTVDAVEFMRLAGTRTNSELHLANDLYVGQLLDGISVRDQAFDDWLGVERTRLHEIAISTADRLLAEWLKIGDDNRAIAAAQRLLKLDPLRESTYRTLMRLYSAQNQRGLAARQFQICQEVLLSHFNIEPAPATRNLYEEIASSYEEEIAGSHRLGRHIGHHDLKAAPLPLPAKPSVAIMPFTNASGDPDQSYLSDGLTEDIITDLSRYQSLFVIGPESSMALKTRTTGLQSIARELGVEYMVEGSVRRAGGKIRISVHLIDPATGHRIWAERYDRRYAEVFDVQDEIVASIAGSLSAKIERTRYRKTRGQPKEAMDGYDLCLRAKQRILEYTSEGFAEAKELLLSAVEREPDNATAWAGLAIVYNKDTCFTPGAAFEKSIERSRECSEKAIALDRSSDLAYAALSWAHMNLGNFDLARQFLDHATELAPFDSEILVYRAYEEVYLGNFEAALEAADYGCRINPYSPDLYLDAKAIVYFVRRQHDDYRQLFAHLSDPLPETFAWHAANEAYLGNHETANQLAEKFLVGFAEMWAGDPDAGPGEYVNWITNESAPFANEADRQILIEGLRLAGLPV